MEHRYAHKSDHVEPTRPLTFGQKWRLIRNILPLISFSAICVLVIGVLMPMFGQVPPLTLWIVIGATLLFTGHDAVRSAWDLLSGVALVRDDVLEKSTVGRHGRHYGRFTTLGRARIVPKARNQGVDGWRHRVVYSPVSKIVWELEPYLNPNSPHLNS
jgi:hypothetical protein